MLRREKIFDNIMNKRMTCLDSKLEDNEIVKSDGALHKDLNMTKDINNYDMDKWTIHSNMIKITEEDQNFFEKINDKIQKVEILKQYFIKRESNGYNYKHFAIYHIKLCFLKIFQSVSIRTALLDEELCLLVLNEFLASKDIAALCDLGFILTQMTYYSEKACEMVLDENILKQLLDKISLENIKIQENILIIIGNVVVQHKEFILLNTDYVLVLKQLLIYHQSLLESWNNSDIRKIILWNFSLITNKMANQEKAQFECLIPIFKKYLKKENLREMKRLDKNQEEINQLLTVLSEISNNDVIIESLIVNRIFDDLVYLLQYLNIAYSKELKYDTNNLVILTTDNLLLTLITLNNIFCGSDDSLIHYKVLNPDLIEIYENLLMRYRFFQKEDKKIVIEIVWALSNIASGPSGYQNLIMKTEIPKNLLRFYSTNKDPNITNEILKFFEHVFIKGGDSAIVEVLKLNFIKFLFDNIKSHDNQDIIKSCLNCISFLIKFSNKFYSPLEEKQMNVIHTEFIKHSIITRLEQLAIHNNPQISKNSQELLNEVEKMIDEDQMMS